MRNVMNSAVSARAYGSARRGDATRLLVVPSAGKAEISSMGALEYFLRPGDLLVMNESGTVPASLACTLERTGESVEIRLAAREGEALWLAVTFGAGSWRRPTENRGEPPALHAGDILQIGENFRARIRRLDARHPRLVHLRLEGEGLYRHGAPVQYSYHRERLSLFDAETLVAGMPWSVEAPSALFPLTADRLLRLREKFTVVPLIHGAGLSSTGDPQLDALLPLPEPYRIPLSTMEAVRRTRANGGRVLAWGTTVARALESAFESGRAEGMAELKLGPNRPARVVDGLLTGFHEPDSSHFQLECALVPGERMLAAYELGRESGFLGHEYGDLVLLWR
ncbi:MAG: S-adenosylmethionine:tRNA ribosyltransferase-isomerase [Bdellovibrionota bacterium]